MACALRSVCRRFRDAMEAYRFRIVALEWHTCMVAFLDTFKASSKTAQASVRHLFLLVDVDFDEDETPVGKAVFPSCTCFPHIYQPVEDIITLVSRRLETFWCIINQCHVFSALDSILHTPFPRLTHLTFWHRDLRPRVTSNEFQGELYPSLIDLHIGSSGVTMFRDGNVIALDLIRRAPRNCHMHVRLSGIALYRFTQADFAIVLGLAPPTSSFSLRLPRSVDNYTLVLNQATSSRRMAREGPRRTPAYRYICLIPCADINGHFEGPMSDIYADIMAKISAYVR
ncbi:hypothetical protein NEOLEDRAFT_154800 [Neolentinus lepideus HHB14362 ss-1]|uniref:F-box domain-containing protein n=1 Tax=Neolentinus lepideus HHB14362 ss-1 TaxID=1314782 RepID=A0A165TRY0_9AGAM|nr:hypothetical protein NEOLEDRAFT_154800 [Neolentinus lepideus HHB14362 ss-1]